MNKAEWVSYTGYVKRPIRENVFEASLARLRDIFDRSSAEYPVIVSFSGGKDSTVLLMLSLQVAKEKDMLPLKVTYVDEELLDPDTLNYITQVGEWPEVEFLRITHPVQHTYRSELRAHWWPWHPDKEDVWARPKPADGIDLYDYGVPGVKNTYRTVIDALVVNYLKLPGYYSLAGIRTEESLNRLRGMFTAGKVITHPTKYQAYCTPIYDWTWRDVWRAIKENDWPYSPFYEKAFMTGMSFHRTRIAAWGNVSSVSECQFYQAFYPKFWEMAIRRLPEMATLAKHGTDGMYKAQLPPGMTYQEYAFLLLEAMDDEEARDFWKETIATYLMRWEKKSTVPFPDLPLMTTTGWTSTMSWHFLASAIVRNDLVKGKGGKIKCRDIM